MIRALAAQNKNQSIREVLEQDNVANQHKAGEVFKQALSNLTLGDPQDQTLLDISSEAIVPEESAAKIEKPDTEYTTPGQVIEQVDSTSDQSVRASIVASEVSAKSAAPQNVVADKDGQDSEKSEDTQQESQATEAQDSSKSTNAAEDAKVAVVTTQDQSQLSADDQSVTTTADLSNSQVEVATAKDSSAEQEPEQASISIQDPTAVRIRDLATLKAKTNTKTETSQEQPLVQVDSATNESQVSEKLDPALKSLVVEALKGPKSDGIEPKSVAVGATAVPAQTQSEEASIAPSNANALTGILIRQAIDSVNFTMRQSGAASSTHSELGKNANVGELMRSKDVRENKPRIETITRPMAQRAIQRVEQALKEAALSKDGKTITVRIDPPALGKVKVDVTIKNGELSAKIVAENKQIGGVIWEHAADLQKALRKLGLNVDRVNVSVAGNNSQVSQESAQNTRQGKQEQKAKPGGLAGDAGVEVVGGQVAGEVVENNIDHWVA